MKQDLKYAFRQLMRNPVFAFVAVATLALGIGANVVVAGWIQGTLLNSVPGARDPGRLVAVVLSSESGIGETMSYPNLRDLGRENAFFEGALGSDMGTVHIRDGERSEWVWTELVTANYFELLGVQPLIGQTRFPADSDERPGSAPHVVISERFWKHFFNGDPGVIGRVVGLNQQPFTVVGVAPAQFKGVTGGLALDLWIPVSMTTRMVGIGAPVDRRGWNAYHTVARLKPGVSFKQANAAAGALAARLRSEFPGDIGKQTSFQLLPLYKCPWGAQALFYPLLQALGGATTLVLLLVIANLAGLQLSRATTRQREISIRLALGAGRGRLIRQLLLESMVLALLGGVLAVLVAHWGLGLMRVFVPATHLPVAMDFVMNWQLVVFGAGLALVGGVLFGLAPAIHSVSFAPAQAMNDGARGTEAKGGRLILRRALAVAQVSISLVLLVACVLCLRSFSAAHQVPLGFNPRQVWLGGFHLDSHGFDGPRATAFIRDVTAALKAQPGVQAVGFSEGLPLGFEGGSSGILEIPGNPAQTGENRSAHFRRVSPGFFEAMETRIVQGRAFEDRDTSEAPSRVVVNQLVADRLFQGRNPVGLRLKIWGRECEIIGVAESGKYKSLAEPPAYAVWGAQAQWGTTHMTAVVRTRGNAQTGARLLEQAVKSVAPEVQVSASDTLENYISPSFLLPRTAAVLLSALSAVALVLAVLGIYGIMSFQVSRRQREIGIRMALGADRKLVRAMVLGQGMRMAGLGLLIGLALAAGVTRILSGLLVGVKPEDPVAFVSAIVLLSTACLASIWIPARRASSVNPVEALRSE